MEPLQKPGRSKQDYETPADFLAAAKARLGIDQFVFDFACRPDNAKAENFNHGDSLAIAWEALDLEHGWAWLNPPFADIAPWAQRCAQFKRDGGHVALLVPAAVGANWFRDHVHCQASVLFLNGRIKFVGAKDYYPKDCILALYSPFYGPGYDVWSWRQEVVDASTVAPRAAHTLVEG
jgi:hypothetical protein